MKTLASLLIASVLMSAGCTSEGYRGNTCVGIADPDENPELEYKLSAWNITMAILFSPSVIVPVYVLVDEVKCPVGPKSTARQM
jgi:hypothetical protein